MSAAFERVSVDMEEAARTLGAKPFSVFHDNCFAVDEVLDTLRSHNGFHEKRKRDGRNGGCVVS